MASLSSFRASRSFNSSSSELNLRINLQDNTVSQPPTAPASEAGDVLAQPSNASATSSAAPGRRETLLKAITQRKYRGWAIDPAASIDDDLEIANGDGAPDPRAGEVVENPVEGDTEVIPSGSGEEDRSPRERGRDRSNTGGNAIRNSTEHVLERRKSQKQKKQEIAEIDILYENQRGAFVCGIPLFSSNGLLNFDPAPWQNGLFRDSAVSIVNAQLPDPSWAWAWKTWYVDMTQDVDEEGWAYSFSFNPVFSWHGNHVWFHSFVRRRRWLRKRIKISHNPDFSSREGSQERPHGLNRDYFTIHSQHLVDSGSARTGAGKRKQRRSVMEGGEWTGQNAEMDDDLEEEGLITDIPKLLRVLKIARLDREKIEVVEKFLKDGGEEVAYLPERIPHIMSLMIFQASRRQLLKLLIAAADELIPSQPPPTASTPHAKPSDLPPADGASALQQGLEPQSGAQKADQKAAGQRKHENLKRAIESAEQEVRRLEYWSDVKEAAAGTEGAMKVAEEQTDGLPLGMDDSRLRWKGKEVER